MILPVSQTLLIATFLLLGEGPLHLATAQETRTHNYLTPELFWTVLVLMFIFLGDMIYVLLKSRKTERELKESMKQIQLLLDSAAEGIYGLDLDGNCTFCNPACLKMLGYLNEQQMLGKNLHAIIHHTKADGSPYPADECKICHAYLYNSEVHLEDEVLWRSDGTSFPVEYWSYPLRHGNQTIGAVVSFLDITERKRAEQKLRQVNQELDAFVYTVTHDLRTPISAVIGYADVLREAYADNLPDDAMDLLKTIENQADKMSLLVEDLLALATAGNIEPPDRPIEAKPIVDYVLCELKNQIRDAEIEVIVGELPIIQVPETLLIQLFENLINNSLRYAGPDAGPLEIGGRREGYSSIYWVRDHGVGVPADERPHLFNVFYRGTTGKSLPGSGVGLATVQKICQLYGGRASVEETPGGGATFRVEMMDAAAPQSVESP